MSKQTLWKYFLGGISIAVVILDKQPDSAIHNYFVICKIHKITDACSTIHSLQCTRIGCSERGQLVTDGELNHLFPFLSALNTFAASWAASSVLV